MWFFDRTKKLPDLYDLQKIHYTHLFRYAHLLIPAKMSTLHIYSGLHVYLEDQSRLTDLKYVYHLITKFEIVKLGKIQENISFP